MQTHENKLIAEIKTLQNNFRITTDKLIKDVKRQDKIMIRSDKRQQKEYDELMALKIEIEETQREVVFTMGAIGESRSKETGNHVKRVAEYSYLLAKYYGLPEKECEMLKQASPMHDIGKVAIPDAVLNKPGRFNDEERAIMDTHAQLGYDMLKYSNRSLLKMASIVAYEHHEKYNGKGYPNQLAGEDIHIYGRITALADVFDALGSERVYKSAWDDARIFKMFKEERGEHFDPKLIDIFFDNLDEFLHIRDTMKDMVEE
jgi:response regulator RpfG family c-di-GMP phosphodiesterase